MVVERHPKRKREPDTPRDTLEIVVRFTFGAALGVLLVFAFLTDFDDELGQFYLPMVIIVILGFAVAAVRYGDSFWYWVAHHFFGRGW